MRNKVQKNDCGVNVLVETNESSNTHYSHLNFFVEIEKVLTDEEILQQYLKKSTKEEKLKSAKNWIKKQDGFAVSNVIDETINVDYDSIIAFKKQ